MNNRIKSLINTISQNFKSIYGVEISTLEKEFDTEKLIGYTIVNLKDWRNSEIELIIESTLNGINYYILNSILIDKQKNGFPFASFISIINVLENNQTEIFVYTKKIPVWNQALKDVLDNNGITY